MPVPKVINLNNTTPAAPSGRLNAQFQGDSNSPRNVSANTFNHGQVDKRTTTTESVGQASQGKYVSFGNASATAVTIATPTDSTFMFYAYVQGAGTCTFTPASGTINGNATLILTTGQAAIIFWDGTNWEAIPIETSGSGGAPTTDEYILGAQDFTNLPNSVAIPALYLGPDVQPATAGSLDDEFPGSTLNAAWTWVNQGSATAVVGQSLLGMMAPANSGATVRYIYKTAPSTPWRVNAKINVNGIDANYWHAGLIIADSSGKLITLDLAAGSATPIGAGVNHWTSYTVYGAQVGHTILTGAITYLGLEDDGTNVTYWCSPDGVNWIQIAQESRTTFLASGPTRVGLAVDVESLNGPVLLSCDWFRRTL